ncbi:MAG: hypothetical protein DI569_02655 [Sphingopyxis macrogoltabida]|uniref:Uncharacterized protein n=1 Tax=Sphingopyxis macrogoltabida TaxID=33050 RepID=A0A2W5L3F9_SPHMC|nr:MAG: hypothetical protein DI569_02655 [Sphingopyxis macrogoltabida]
MTDSVFDTPLLTVREAELLARAKRELEAEHASESTALKLEIRSLKLERGALLECFTAASAYASALIRTFGPQPLPLT